MILKEHFENKVFMDTSLLVEILIRGVFFCHGGGENGVLWLGEGRLMLGGRGRGARSRSLHGKRSQVLKKK